MARSTRRRSLRRCRQPRGRALDEDAAIDRRLYAVRDLDQLARRRQDRRRDNRRWTSSITDLPNRLLIPVEIRPDIRIALAAGRADEARLDVREPEVVGPSISVDRERMAAMVVGACAMSPPRLTA
jgi:hypothetical protein